MASTEWASLVFVFGGVLATGLLLFPLGNILPRGVHRLIAFAGWATSTTFAVLAVRAVLTLGNWGQPGGFRGMILTLRAPGTLPVDLALDPAGALLSVAVLISGGALLFVGERILGGGRTDVGRPLTAPQVAAGLVLLGGLCVLTMVRNLGWLVLLTSLLGFVGFGLLLSTQRKHRPTEKLGPLFVFQRLSDAVLLCALAVTWVAYGTLDAPTVVGRLITTDAWQVAEAGVFAGFPASTVRWLVGVLFCSGLLLRVVPFPFVRVLHGTAHASMTVVGLCHGLSFWGPVLLIARWLTFAFVADPVVHVVATTVCALTLLAAALTALNRDRAAEVDLFALHSWGCLALLGYFCGEMYGGFLTSALFIIVLGPLLLPMGAAVEAMQGKTSLMDLGGLWRALRISDATRAMITLALCFGPGLSAFEILFYGELASPRGVPWVALLAAGAFFVLALALFRSLHLAFSGETPRTAPPAVLVEIPWRRGLFLVVLALVVGAAGLVLTWPDEIARLVSPNFYSPIEMMFTPAARLHGAALFRHAPAAPDVPDSLRVTGFVAGAALAGLAYAVSALLYRGGPTPRYERLRNIRQIQPLYRALEAETWWHDVFGRLVVRPVAAVSRYAVGVFFPVFVDGLVSRTPALVLAGLRALLRRGYSGDVQRAMALVMFGAALLLYWWSHA